MSAYDNGNFGFGKRERRGRRSELPEDVIKKLKSCSVMGCEEWRDLTSHTTYHCFPTGEKNQARWEIWTSLLQKARDDASWIPFRGSLVCSHHFRQIDFVHDPNQKRTKLVKNAIPSVFPTFQVDLDDPDFVLEDSQEDYEGIDGDDTNGYAEDVAEYSNQNSYDEYDDQYQEYEYEQEGDETEIEIPIPEVQYDEEGGDEPELHYANREHPRPPKLIPAAKIAARSQEMYSEGEPPRKKPFTSNLSPPALKKSQVSTKGGSPQNGNAESSLNEVSKPSSSVPKLIPKSKLYEQLCKSTTDGSNTSKTPFSWNPDLEIEVLNPSSPSDETDSLRQRIEELENEKEALKNKYETQIRALQRKVREQDRIINEYAVQMNSLKRQRAV